MDSTPNPLGTTFPFGMPRNATDAQTIPSGLAEARLGTTPLVCVVDATGELDHCHLSVRFGVYTLLILKLRDYTMYRAPNSESGMPLDLFVRQLIEMSERLEQMTSALADGALSQGMIHVYDQGTSHGPMSFTKANEWRHRPADCTIDLAQSQLFIRQRGQEERVVRCTGKDKLAVSFLAVLAISVPNRVTPTIYAKMTQTTTQKRRSANWMSRRATEARLLIGDNARDPKMIICDDSSIARGAYYASPHYTWRVILPIDLFAQQ